MTQDHRTQDSASGAYRTVPRSEVRHVSDPAMRDAIALSLGGLASLAQQVAPTLTHEQRRAYLHLFAASQQRVRRAVDDLYRLMQVYLTEQQSTMLALLAGDRSAAIRHADKTWSLGRELTAAAERVVSVDSCASVAVDLWTEPTECLRLNVADRVAAVIAKAQRAETQPHVAAIAPQRTPLSREEVVSQHDAAFTEQAAAEVYGMRVADPASFGTMDHLEKAVADLSTAMTESASLVVIAEAIKVGALAMRIVAEGDSSFDLIRNQNGADPHGVELAHG